MLIPNEILLLIFQELVPNQTLHQCALVNKIWYNVALAPMFFKEVEIYSKEQLDLFIRAATEMKVGNKKMMGQEVKKISLHFEIPISTITMEKLQHSCPNISVINYSPLAIHAKKYEIVNKWPHLTHLPIWHSENIEDCILYLNSTLESFTFYATSNDCNALKRGETPNSLNPTTQLLNLKELHLKNAEEQTYLSFNAKAFEAIHFLCPYLTTLTISNHYSFEMKNDAIESLSSSPLHSPSLSESESQSLIQLPPPPSYSEPAIFSHRWSAITNLCFKSIKIDTHHFFTFIARNYPNLESLTLENISIYKFDFLGFMHGHFSSTMKELKQAMKQMIIDLSPRLKALYISFDKNNEYAWKDYWANIELLDYLDIYVPTQLKRLKWPSTIYPAIIEGIYDIQCIRLYREIKPLGFIYQLEELHLPLLCISKETLDYLLGDKKIISTNLKRLFIETSEFLLSPQLLYLYCWLDAFPSLQYLSASRLTLVTQEPFNENIQDIQYQPQYKSLQSLTIHQCDLFLEGGFSHLFQRCPQLNHLECFESRYYLIGSNITNNMITEKVKEVINGEPYVYHTLIYAPHINMNTLKLCNMEFIENNNTLLVYNRILIASGSSTRKSLAYNKEEYDNGPFRLGKKNTFLVIYANGIEKYFYDSKWMKY